MGSLQKILEKYHMEKWFQRDNLIILVLAGILLVVIALPTEGAEEGTKTQNLDVLSEAGQIQDTVASAALNEYESVYAYAFFLEEKLENTLKEMNGVGRVRVMITLETSEERVVEKDEPLVRNNTAENDSNGGSRTVYQTETGQETVYENRGEEEIPYVTKTILPKISGVLIVAEGAGRGNISKSITDIAQALFDLEAHKIKVVAMSEE